MIYMIYMIIYCICFSSYVFNPSVRLPADAVLGGDEGVNQVEWPNYSDNEEL